MKKNYFSEASFLNKIILMAGNWAVNLKGLILIHRKAEFKSQRRALALLCQKAFAVLPSALFSEGFTFLLL